MDTARPLQARFSGRLVAQVLHCLVTIQQHRARRQQHTALRVLLVNRVGQKHLHAAEHVDQVAHARAGDFQHEHRFHAEQFRYLVAQRRHVAVLVDGLQSVHAVAAGDQRADIAGDEQQPGAIGIRVDHEHLNRDAVTRVGKHHQADQEIVLLQPAGDLVGAQAGSGEYGRGGEQRHDRQQQKIAVVAACAPSPAYAHAGLPPEESPYRLCCRMYASTASGTRPRITWPARIRRRRSDDEIGSRWLANTR